MAEENIGNIEAKVEKQIDKVEAKVEKQIDKAVNAEIKKLEEDKASKEVIKQEVKKRLGEKFFEKTRKAGTEFGREFRNQILVAITAAFSFLIALSWREPISEGVSSLIARFGLKENLIYYKFLSAIIITLIGVIFLVILVKWNSGKK